MKKETSSNSNLLMVLKDAFAIKKAPYPWTRAILAGICLSFPVMIGLLAGNFQYGLLAGIGGFTYLYTFNEPYPQRAKKLFIVALGLSASIAVGILTISSPLAFTIMIGLIGAVCTFIFGALKIPGPASIFFVMVFAMTSAMPIDPTLAPSRASLVFLGGSFSWLIAMIGWFFNPYGPETKAIKTVYLELATLICSVRTEQFNDSRERTIVSLKHADNLLLAGYVSWKTSPIFKRLYLLKEQSNSILADVLEMSAAGRTNLPVELGKSVQALAQSIDHKRKSKPLQILQPTDCDEEMNKLFSKIYHADAILNQSISRINQEIKVIRTPLKRVLLDAFDKNSIVFLSSIKYGIVLMVATMIAFSYEFDRSYWIPISCGSVMLGSTVISTFHRAIQRSIGTIVGILVASLILSTKPEGLTIALFILLLSFLTELFIVRNYAFAVTFITPSALLMAESTSQIHNIPYFATARVTDTLIGCAIGLIGVLMVGRQSASSRLSHLIAKTIRSQSQLLFQLFSKQKSSSNFEGNSTRNKMRTNLMNLKTVYSTALGEIPINKKALEFLWPAIFSIEQLGYLLDSIIKDSKRPVLSDEKLAQLLFIFETIANAVEQLQIVTNKNVPEIEGFSKIQKEIIALQDAITLIGIR